MAQKANYQALKNVACWSPYDLPYTDFQDALQLDKAKTRKPPKATLVLPHQFPIITP